MKLRSLHTTKILEFYAPDYSTKLELPFGDVGISAGFPSPADDFIVLSLESLNPKIPSFPAKACQELNCLLGLLAETSV